ncbi:hypothetical protein PGT21_035805 [Puccinia graminis f. sp. tritici]|uniref:Uncharacterized protein n=1 Tax=Puccinia graminis f. sp. tritici TaxID=56615 RepID=A0A5B0QQ93_PUCGR|nr:hypothetical protein PGT21_035805 [Puccinia graminis f. sp. tritici]
MKLENIVELKPPDTKQEDVILGWAKFFQGYKGSFARLKEILKLTDADHENQIKQLVKLAHFVRFPMEKEHSGRSQEEMLTRIQSDKKSRKSQQQRTEYKRFEKFHDYDEDEIAGKFIAIVEAAGDLSVFRCYWARFYQGGRDSFPELKKRLKLTYQDHQHIKIIRKFFQLAYFNRFPNRQDSSRMSTDKILIALRPKKSSP